MPIVKIFVRTVCLGAMYDTLEEITALLGQAEESVSLEFKSGRTFDEFNSARSELVKDVTAFANAGGGTILFGIQSRLDGGRSVADQLEPVTNQAITKDRLAEIIWSNTDPPFGGFKIDVIPVAGTEAIYVIRVDQGDTAYQNRIDRKFYQRVEAMSQPMYAFAIRDVMNRRTTAVVRAVLNVRPISLGPDFHHYRIVPTLTNDGMVTAHHWTLQVDVPCRPVRIEMQTPLTVMIRGEIEFEHWTLQRYEYSSERRPAATNLRLLPGEQKVLDVGAGFPDFVLEITSNVGQQLLRNRPPIHWSLFVDNAPKQEGTIDYDDWCQY